MRPPLPEGPYLVVGLARSGVAVCRALRESAPEVAVVACDSGPPQEAIEASRELSALGVEMTLDSDGVALLDGEPRPRCVVKSPGVPQDAPVIVAARERGLTVTGELEIAWRLLPNRFCAVTGTNGKTTTTELIAAILRAAGEPCAVAGNVGVAAASLVGRVDPGAIVVCETSSFQLEDALDFRPEVGVFLNFAADHLDRHPSLDDYLDAKLALFVNQVGGDAAVLNAGDAALHEIEMPGGVERIWFVAGSAGSDRGLDMCERDGAVWWRGVELIGTDEIRLRGRHNLENAMAAACAAFALGVSMGAVAAALRDFGGVEHRLEEVGERNGVLFVNDSKATNVASAKVGIEAFDSGVHLILGGSVKGGGFTELREPIGRHSCAVYLIGESAERIRADLAGIEPPLNDCGDLERAIDAAAAAAQPGEVVLLSPACASFDQYADYEQRGADFRRIFERLA